MMASSKVEWQSSFGSGTSTTSSKTQMRRALESSSVRLTRTFSDPIPLVANEEKKYTTLREDRHIGKQLNGLLGTQASKKVSPDESDGAKLLGVFTNLPPLCNGDPYTKTCSTFKPGKQMQAFSGGGKPIHRGENVGVRRLLGTFSNPLPLCIGDQYLRPEKGQPYLFGDPFGFVTQKIDHAGSGRYRGKQMGNTSPVHKSPVSGLVPSRPFHLNAM